MFTDFIKAMEKIAEQGNVEVHVVNMGAKPDSESTEPKSESKGCVDPKAETEKMLIQDAAEIAHLNKVLYDEHIKAGFSPEQAILIVAASNN